MTQPPAPDDELPSADAIDVDALAASHATIEGATVTMSTPPIADAQASSTISTVAALDASLRDEVSVEELEEIVKTAGVKMPGPIQQPPPLPASLATPTPPARQEPRPNHFAPLAQAPETAIETGLGMLLDVPLRVSVELGRISMSLQHVLGLGRGSIIELNRLAGEPVDILVNEKLIGRGEVVVVDENFGVKVTELIDAKG